MISAPMLSVLGYSVDPEIRWFTNWGAVSKTVWTNPWRSTMARASRTSWCVWGGPQDRYAGPEQPQLQVGAGRRPCVGGMAEGLGRPFRVSVAKGDDRRHDHATVIGQPLGGAQRAISVAESKAETGFELVGLGQEDRVVAP